MIIPAGQATWSNQLVITKGINLIGAGIGNTIITSAYASPSNRLIKYAPAKPFLDEPFRFSGFEINCNSSSSAFELYNSSHTHALTKIRIDHCKFYDAPSVNMFLVQGHVYGVIDNNIIKFAPSPRNQMTDHLGLNELSWSNFTFEFGSANNLYWEDNVITINDLVTAAGHGGRYCYRYNSITYINQTASAQIFDMHGNQPGMLFATMGAEIYDNTIVIQYVGGKLLDQRGGMALVYDNIITANNPVFTSIRDEYKDDICLPKTTSDGETQHVNRSYYWNNIANGHRVNPYVSSTISYGGVIGVAPKPDRDYFAQVNSFNGSTGMGVGLLAARPSSCTLEGAGYWATDTKTLYRWTTGKWREYYKPYKYPHPLRNEN